MLLKQHNAKIFFGCPALTLRSVDCNPARMGVFYRGLGNCSIEGLEINVPTYATVQDIRCGNGCKNGLISKLGAAFALIFPLS